MNETIDLSRDSAVATAPFLQENNNEHLVCMEAENYHSNQVSRAGQRWRETTEMSGYSGTSAMEASPFDSAGCFNSGYSTDSAGMNYNINFVTTGTHYVWIRGIGPSTRSDSLHIGFDGTEIPSGKKLAGFNKSWRWSSTQQSSNARIIINVNNPGVHTLNLWMREAGMIVDKIILTTDPAYMPRDLGPTPSLQSGAPIVATPIINPTGGNFVNSALVILSTTPPDAQIYYTIDSSSPSTDSVKYTGAFSLENSATVKAKGFFDGYSESSVVSADFIISKNSETRLLILNKIGDKNIHENETLRFSISTNESDFSTQILSADLTALPLTANFDSATGAFSWSPALGDADRYSVTFTVTDATDPTLNYSETIDIVVEPAIQIDSVPYVQANGDQYLVAIEADAYHTLQDSNAGQRWIPITEKPGFSGAAAMQAIPLGSSGYYNPGYAATSAAMNYNIEFVTTGTHYVWIRGIGPSTRSDSLHVGLDGIELPSSQKIAGFKTSWKWTNSQQSTNARVTINIANAGLHTLNLWMRESGMIVDKIVLTTDVNYVPTDTGPSVSILSGTPVVSRPVISPTGGTFGDSVLISLNTTTEETKIYFTIDGTEPTESSQQYHTPIELTESAVLKTIATKSGHVDSAIEIANFIKVNESNTTSLYSHYWEMNETTPGIYIDSVASNNGFSASSPTADRGIINGCQDFNGVDNEVNVADDGGYNWDNDSRWSIEAWVNTNTRDGSGVIIGRNDNNSALQWWIGCENGHAAFELVDKIGNGTKLTSNAFLDDGNWHHIVAIRDGFNKINLLYVDGILEKNASANYDDNGFSSTVDINIGWLNDNSVDYHFNGKIDELAMASRVLTESEILQHFNDGRIGLARGYLSPSAALKIMPLGDSITNRVGYRPELFQALSDYGYNVNFVGGGTDPSGTHDRNHEGHSGYSPAEIAHALPNWLRRNSPELVLLHIGTNGQDLAGVEDILNVIDDYNPAIPVVLARIINRATYHQPTSDYNLGLQAMAESRVANGDKILVVDHESALNYSTDLIDDKHPNSLGYTKMKNVWLAGLKQLIQRNQDVVPIITSTPSTNSVNAGEVFSYQVEAEGYPVLNYHLKIAPMGMQIHPDTGNITWKTSTPGNVNITVEVSNIIGMVSQSFVVSVQ